MRVTTFLKSEILNRTVRQLFRASVLFLSFCKTENFPHINCTKIMGWTSSCYKLRQNFRLMPFGVGRDPKDPYFSLDLPKPGENKNP